jgi:hypothetical protein
MLLHNVLAAAALAGLLAVWRALTRRSRSKGKHRKGSSRLRLPIMVLALAVTGIPAFAHESGGRAASTGSDDRRVAYGAGISPLGFTADFVGGVSIATRRRRSIVLGTRFHHISNGGRASPNRGLNTFVLFGGVSAFR